MDTRTPAELAYDRQRDGTAYVKPVDRITEVLTNLPSEDTDQITKILDRLFRTDEPGWSAGYAEGWKEGRRALIQEIERQLREGAE